MLDGASTSAASADTPPVDGNYGSMVRDQSAAANRKLIMTEKELLKLKKSELLEIMLAQSREIDSLREQLAKTQSMLDDRNIAIAESGSIAEASLRLTKIFEEAQKAADLYLDNVKKNTGSEE